MCLLTLLQQHLVFDYVCDLVKSVVLFQKSETPLDRASWCGHLHTVRLLLQRGAVVDSRDDVRQSQCITDVEYVPLRMSIIFHHYMIEVFRHAM